WGMMIGFSGINYTAWLYIAWLPGYLQSTYHLDLKSTGLLATRLRNANGDVAPNDFLALALIALSYSLVEWLGASGF
ncbi:hypothetical protein HZD82_28135, partial [Pantoea agglomerans]|uniref:hypothetical protein n=1 Tax=Enterobacter agglomerans TaxID=549 RepID=UPI001A8F4C6F